MNHRRVRSRSPSKKSKMKRSPKTKQKSLTRKSQRMKTKRSSTRRKSPLLILRSLKKRLSSRSSLKRKSPLLIVRSPKKSSRQINNNDDGKKSRHRKEVHYQQPLVPNYKIIRNKNTSYYEKKEDEEENYYNHRPFSYAPVPTNSGYSAPSMILPPDDNKIPPESSMAVVLENENKNKIKRNDNIRLMMPRRNTRSKMSFKKNHSKVSTKLFLDDRDIKTIERKVAKDYKKGKFKTYDELPVNVKERLSEKKYYNIFKKVEKKYSVPEVETENNNNNSEKEVESVVEETTINEPTNEVGVEQVATNESTTSSETI